MYKVDIVYICQMDFNNRSYREIICSGNLKTFFLQIGRQHQTFIGTKKNTINIYLFIYLFK